MPEIKITIYPLYGRLEIDIPIKLIACYINRQS